MDGARSIYGGVDKSNAAGASLSRRLVVVDLAPWAGGRGGSRSGKIELGAGQYDQIDRTIARLLNANS